MGPEIIILTLIAGALSGVSGLVHLWTRERLLLRSVGLTTGHRLVFSVLMFPAFGVIAMAAAGIYWIRFARHLR